MLKYRNHYKSRTTNGAPPQGRKIKLSDVEFDEEKLGSWLAAQRKSKKRCYYNVYSDDGVEFSEEFSESNSDSGDEKIVKKENKTQTRKRTVARTTNKPVAKKRRKNNKKEL